MTREQYAEIVAWVDRVISLEQNDTTATWIVDEILYKADVTVDDALEAS